MNDLERVRLLVSARKLKECEETSEPFEDPYSDMTLEEKSKMIMELTAARERDAARIQRGEARIDELLSKVDELLSLQKAAMAAGKERDDYKQMNNNLLSKITALEERLKYVIRTFMAVRARRVSIKEAGVRRGPYTWQG